MVVKYLVEDELEAEANYIQPLQASNAFGRKFRLTERHQFLRFFEKSECIRLSECIIFRISSPEKHYRLGVTFKAKGSSIIRNRVKRTIRENFRQYGALLGQFDYNVVIPKHKKLDSDYAIKLAKCLRSEWKRRLERKG